MGEGITIRVYGRLFLGSGVVLYHNCAGGNTNVYIWFHIYIYKITHTQGIEVIQGYDESA